MARPSKSVATMSKNLTKEEREFREAQEEKLRGNADKIKPPSYLLPAQKRIFNTIVKELTSANILSNLDVHILSLAATSIYYIQEIEKSIIENPVLMTDAKTLSAKDKYTKEFFRVCNELSLSPASRAKLGNINLQAKQNGADPLLQALKGDAN